jgi:hypothetical protein
MKNQEWKILRATGKDPLAEPTQAMIMFNGEPLGLVQSYSIGQNHGSQYETLLLEIICPNLSIENLTFEEFGERFGTRSKYKDGGEETLPKDGDLAFGEEMLKTEVELEPTAE